MKKEEKNENVEIKKITDWVEKKIKYEKDSGVWFDAGRQEAFEEVLKFINSLF